MSDIFNGLAALVGRDNVAADPASLEEYARDESFVPHLAPWAVVRPGSAEEVRSVVAWANQTATPLVPVSSGGPHFHGDTVPSVPGAVMLDLRRLDKILRVDRRNRMAVIEPGVTYPQLQAVLAEQGMRITPPLYPRANKSVVTSLLERQPTLIPRYNFQLPEPLRSCGVVWGNGDVMFTGEAGSGPLSLQAQWDAGLVQADPKGPGQTDFFRLLTGAQGTFGVVTWAAVRCEIVPAAHEYLFAAADELDELVDSTYRLDRIRLGDEVLIVNDAYLARLLASRDGVKVEPDELPSWTLILGLADGSTSPPSASPCRRRTRWRSPVSSASTLSSTVPGASTDDIAAALAGCCDTPWKLAAEGACADVFFVGTLEEAPSFVEIAHIVADGHGYAAEDVGVYIQPQHQGVTHHVEFSLPFDASDAATAEDMQELADDLAANLMAAGAYFSRPYGSWAQPVYNRDAAARDALRKVKAIFDPAGVMNPGKLCFGPPKRACALRREGGLTWRSPTIARRDALHPLQLLQVDPVRPRAEPSLRQGLPLGRGRQVPRLLGRRQARHRAEPDGRAQRGDRPGRRRRLQLPALRQLRRGLQAVPLRHGAYPRAARVPRAPRRDGPRAGVLPPADRAHAGGARRQGTEDPRRPQRLGRGPRPCRPVG